MLQCKKIVYKNRIRLKEFFADFDKVGPPRAAQLQTYHVARTFIYPCSLGVQLRSGFIFENQFMSGLSMAGLDKQLTPVQLQA